jgi:anionic cell wall polymer biosynthesis LytR-Cps2A-Psr (LCP) family protein
MNIGGPSCAVSTVKDLTGVPLDYFVEFNVNSFRAMVDTIGGWMSASRAADTTTLTAA